MSDHILDKPTVRFSSLIPTAEGPILPANANALRAGNPTSGVTIVV